MDSTMSQYCVVLVEPTLPENVGSVARAMNNMGVEALRLVNPCDYRSDAAKCLAAHSSEILENAVCFSSLEEAIADASFVIGTTARARDRFATLVDLPQLPALIPSGAGSIALVFGRESSGLTNQELACCHQLVCIPTFGQTKSLNLAQAVMVVLYELSRVSPSGAGISDLSEREVASARDVLGLKEHLFAVLKTVGFLKEHQRETLWQSFSDLIARARLGTPDVRLLRGFLRRTELTIKRSRQQKEP